MMLLLMLVVAFLLILAGFLILSLSRGLSGKGEVEGGGVLIIGPIPIVFGTNQKVAMGLIMLAIALTVVCALVFLTFLRAVG